MSENNTFYSSLQQRLEQVARAGLAQTGILHSEMATEATHDESADDKTKLKNVEARFVNLARAFKASKSKQDHLEKIILENTSLTELKTLEHFNELEKLLKTNVDYGKEIDKLNSQICEMKRNHEIEIETNAELYATMQSKVILKEEVKIYLFQEIYKLKHKIAKLGGSTSGSQTPTEPKPLPLLVDLSPVESDDNSKSHQITSIDFIADFTIKTDINDSQTIQNQSHNPAEKTSNNTFDNQFGKESNFIENSDKLYNRRISTTEQGKLERIRLESREHIAGLEFRLSQLQQKFTTVDDNYAKVQAELTEKNKMIDVSKSKIESLEKEITKIKIEEQEIKTSFQEELSKLSAAKDEIESEKLTLIQKLSALETNMTRISAAHQKKSKDFSLLNEKYLELEGKFKELGQNSAGHNNALSDVNNLVAKIEDIELQKTRLNEQVILLEARIQLLSEKNVDYNQFAAELNEQCAKIETIVFQNGFSVTSLENNIKDKYEQLQNLASNMIIQITNAKSSIHGLTTDEFSSETRDFGLENVNLIDVKENEANSESEQKSLELLDKEQIVFAEKSCSNDNGKDGCNSEFHELKSLFTIESTELKLKFEQLEIMQQGLTKSFKQILENVSKLERKLSKVGTLTEQVTNIEPEMKGNEQPHQELQEALIMILFLRNEIEKLKSEVHNNSEHGKEKLNPDKSGLEIAIQTEVEESHAEKTEITISKCTTSANSAHLETELMETKKRLDEEQEKKTKSIQLLRNAKNRILKLESEVKLKDDIISQLSSEVEKLSSSVQGKALLLEQEQNAAKELKNRIEELQTKLVDAQRVADQIDPLQNALQVERQNAIASEYNRKMFEKQSLEQMEKKISEVEEESELKLKDLKVTNAGMKKEIDHLNSNLKNVDLLVSSLQVEIAESKSILESKSAEIDQLKLLISEKEVQFFASEQKIAQLLEEKGILQKEFKARLKSFKETKMLNDSLRVELNEANIKIQDALAIEERLKNELVVKTNIPDEPQKIEFQVVYNLRKVKYDQMQNEMIRLEKDFEATIKALQSEFQLREAQLKNVNKVPSTLIYRP
jgi:chromosome segregation ATPase